MNLPFYLAAAVAVASTFMVIISLNAVHALLYLVLSLLAVAAVFFSIGAPFAGMLEIIVYAGAIMVLFVFVVMMLNLGKAQTDQERVWLAPRTWIGPSILAGLLLFQLGQVLSTGSYQPAGLAEVGAKAVGIALFGPYLLAVELASMLLTAALVAAYHLGKHE
ncbi:MAG TPA: NADH-quinone oxidoreductase subunit J [Nevskiaceae bacterium]|nr:NADH-quinone oxidoreductase subunit J [Nevskiaceae bacterium]